MSFTPNQLEEAISEAKVKSAERKKRAFVETVEISTALREIDLKNPANRINIEATVPHDLGGKSQVAIFAEGDLAVRAAEAGIKTISRDEIERISKEPKEAKKLANEYAFFLAEPPLMAVCARFLGKILGPRGKMPKPIPPRVELDRFVARYNRIVKIRIKTTPVINAPIGKANLSDSVLAENATAILQQLTAKLPKGATQVKSVCFKTTMGPAVRAK